MKIMAIDQARKGAWSVYDSKTKKLLHYGTYNFDYVREDIPTKNGSHRTARIRKYEYDEVMNLVEDLMSSLIKKYKVKMVFLEDVPLTKSFGTKPLLRLQGALMAYLSRNEIPYKLITPRSWESKYRYSDEELTEELVLYRKYLSETPPFSNMRASKRHSLLAVKKIFDMELENDDLADAILIGHYAVNNIKIDSKERSK